MRAPPNVQDIGQYHERFRHTAESIHSEPRVDRSCNDKCCYILFIIITLIFIATGAYHMSQANFSEAMDKFSQGTSQTNSQSYQGSLIEI